MKSVLSIALVLLVACSFANAEVQVSQDQAGNVQATIGVDLLGLKNYHVSSWAQNVWAPAKLITYPLDYAGYMIGEHPFQSLLVGFLATEASGVTDVTPIGDWLGTDDNSSDSSSTSDDDTTTSADRHDTRIDVTAGDGSPVIININSPGVGGTP